MDERFWQTIAVVAVGLIGLVMVLRGQPARRQSIWIVATLAVVLPLTWVNWWITSGDDLPSDAMATSNVTSRLHWWSLLLVAVVLAASIAVAHFRGRKPAG